MPSFPWEDLINRARVYVDDDHDDDGGWIDPADWLNIGFAEYQSQYRNWVRMGLISPAPSEATFTTYTTTVNGVLATIGVAEDLGDGRLRVITPAQSAHGRSPFWGYTDGTPSWWYAHGTADNLVYTLEPRTTGNYLVRYIATPTAPTLVTDTVDLPFGGDERLVLGMARRAKLKDGSASALLNGLIAEADAQLNMQAFGRANGDSPRVRKVPRTAPQVSFPRDPRDWWYF